MSALGERLAAVRGRVEAALARAGRPPGSARIIGVTKRHPAEVIRAARDHGILDIGESYAQEMAAKIDTLAAPAAAAEPISELAAPSLRWHFIGHLQRNKAKLVVGRAALVHAVDSLALARTIDRLAGARGIVQPVLVAVNLGGEAQKSGVAPEDAAALLETMSAMAHVSCVGLMTMPPLAQVAEDSRPYFHRLRVLRDDLCTPSQPLPELSMGTTGDFEVAVEEGATLVRIGTAIFGPRPM